MDEKDLGAEAIHHGHASIEASLGRVVECLPEAVLLLDREWRIVYANQTARRISRVLPEHLESSSLWDLHPQIAGTKLEQACREALQLSEERHVDGFYYEPFDAWFDLRMIPTDVGIAMHYRSVKPAEKSGAARDSALEQMEREESLRASEERYRLMTELNPQCLWTADRSGRVLYANQTFLEYLGRDFTLHDGTGYIQAFCEEDRERVLRSWSHCVATGEEYAIDARLIRGEDGVARWWHLRARPQRDERGEIERWLGVATDVHESRLAAEQLARQYAEIDRQRRELEAIYRGTPIGMSLYEPKELRLIRLNGRKAEILGMSPEEALGKRFDELMGDMNMLHQCIRRAAQGEPMLNQEVEGVMPTRPDDYRYWNANYSPIFADDGTVLAIAGATVEITQQKRAEAALMQSEKLAAVGRLASSIAHEINNPLESVMNLIYLARQHAALPIVQEFLDTADQELRRVSIIANQTLRFHKQTTRPQKRTGSDLFLSVLSIYEGRLRNLRIGVEHRHREKQPVTCLEGEIRQVLNNLVGNAVDAMPNGGRLLVRSREGVDWLSGRRGLFLTVADTGMGMSAKTRGRIFDAFFTTKGIGGTGLGLWISAEIVARHQGRIRIRSREEEPHRGTVASIFLPFEAASFQETRPDAG
ncbi:Signal transduction histidine kinase [Acidisarcina polymorpha]|uniref:histidine kinase n=1 Tax=Acidisarcina polymorpha TaxID=2211140 RepID=A0A2Z5G592_9BACT|nr:PAS domain-containing protein [Acidisarcina polymorpha]AXC14268.1 Signal transduction histidine kinase [Acidisarcina polymorpha]